MSKTRGDLASTCRNCGRTVPATPKVCPLCDADLSAIPAPAVPIENSRSAATGPIRVLIVEDSTELRHAMRDVLQLDSAFEVVGEATNGVQAIELYQKLRPDVVSMNISMPEMDGLSATEAICSQDHGARIVIVTAHREANAIPLEEFFGASDVLIKPVTASEYTAALMEAAQWKPTIPVLPPDPPDEVASPPAVARGTVTEIGGTGQGKP
jgi:two-component system, chemotaxis family, chemotaxis protein CheY